MSTLALIAALLLAGQSVPASDKPDANAPMNMRLGSPESEAVLRAQYASEYAKLLADAGLDAAEFGNFWEAAREGGASPAYIRAILKLVAQNPEKFRDLWFQAKAENVAFSLLIPNLYALLSPDQPQPGAGGGHEVERGEAPYQAEIYQPWPRATFRRNHMADTGPLWILQHMCGGSLIAPGWNGRRGWVVTA